MRAPVICCKVKLMANNITTKKRTPLRTAQQAIMSTCLFAFILLLSEGSAFSEIVIEGQADRLVLRAKQESLNNIITALGARFDVRLNAPLAEDIRVDRHYTGSLRHIMKRLLDGYDYVLATRQNGNLESMDITVFRRSNTAATAAANPLPVVRTLIEPRGMVGFAN
jgi:hypothetical protein